MKDRKQGILEEARAQFLRYGFKKTSLDDLVRNLSISKGLIYNYFKNKEDLFREVAAVESQVIIDHIRSSIVHESDPRKRLPLYAINRINYIRDYFSMHGGDFSVYEELKDAYRKTIIENPPETFILKEILEEGEKKTVFRTSDNNKRAALINQVIDQFELRWLQMTPQASLSEMTDLFGLLIQGMQNK